MPTIQESLRNYLETQLNANTQGLLFKVFNYETKENQDSTFEDTITNSYRLQEKKFIPCMLLDFENDIIPINGITAINYTIPMVIYMNIDGALISSLDEVYKTSDFSKFHTSLEEFRDAINGINVTIDGINVVFTLDEVVPIGDVDENKLDSNLSFGINIYANTSKELYFGNQVTYSLDEESIIPYSRFEGRGTTVDGEQILNTTTRKNIPQDNVWEMTLDLLYKNTTVHNKILQQLVDTTTSQSIEYDLIVNYPNISPVTKKVFITDGSVSAQLGEYIAINITLKEKVV